MLLTRLLLFLHTVIRVSAWMCGDSVLLFQPASASWGSDVLGKAGCQGNMDPFALQCSHLVALESRWGRPVGTTLGWLFLLERSLTCVWSISYKPDTMHVAISWGPLAPMTAPHSLRIYWERQPQSPGLEKTHGKDFVEVAPCGCREEGLFPVLHAGMCWRPPRSTELLLPLYLGVHSGVRFGFWFR